MVCMAVSLLLLVGGTLASAQWSEGGRWMPQLYPRTFSAQNEGQAFGPRGSRKATQDFFELKSVFYPLQGPAEFYPRSLANPAASTAERLVQTPVQDLVQMQLPALNSRQRAGQIPVQISALKATQNSVQLPVKSPQPAWTPVHNFVPTNDLATTQKPALPSDLNPEIWAPIQTAVQVTSVTLPAQGPTPVLPPPAQGPTPVLPPPAQGLTPVLPPPAQGLTPVLPPPAQGPTPGLPPPAQGLAPMVLLPAGGLTSSAQGSTLGLLPAQGLAPSMVLLPAGGLTLSAQGSTLGLFPAQGLAPSMVLLPAQGPTPVLLPAQGPTRVLAPDQGPTPTVVQPLAQGLVPTLVPQVKGSFQMQSTNLAPPKELLWHFPKVPKMPKQPPVMLAWQQPARVNSVAAACGENLVHVEVKQDMYGTGQLVNPSSLTLGGCAAVGQDSSAHVLIFQSELQACGSVLTMTEDELVYNFSLHYKPESLVGTPIVRSRAAVVNIECHYSRKQNVSSNSLVPTWVPYVSTEVAEEQLVFTLKLMTDDWKYERPSNKYFLGDFIKIEASVMQFNHVPLRLFVDSCVATAAPDFNAFPRYSFIENHGCLVDAKITGSNSHFMPRVHDDVLQFQLEVFKFEQDNSSLIYITCFLKATIASYPTDAEHKACSFTPNGWVAADNDKVCSCCDSKCSLKGRTQTTDEGLQFEVPVGPIFVKEDAPHSWQ